jgi:hypothetical protein
LFITLLEHIELPKNLNPLSSHDVVRVMEIKQSITSGSEYLDELEKMVEMMHKQWVTSDIELRFSTIMTPQNLSWQHGVYRAKMHHSVKGEKVG